MGARTGYDILKRQADTRIALHNLVLSKMKEIDMSIVQQEQLNNIIIGSVAIPPVEPAKPNVPLVLVGGGLSAVLLAVGLALFVNFLDDSIKSQDDVETYLRLPFLGYVPNIKTNSVVERYLQSHLHPQSNAAESFRTVRAAVSLGPQGEKLRVLAVTCTLPNEGKSLVSCNLATVIAQTGLKTLLVDADLHRPTCHKTFQLKNQVGLTTYLLEKSNDINELINTTEVPNLDVVSSGEAAQQPSELIASRRMVQFLQEVGKRYDRVVIDCPPVLAFSDPLVLAAMTDGVIYVIKFNKVRREYARKSIQRLQEVGASVCGVLLNNIDFEGRDAYYYSYYYVPNRHYSTYYRSREFEVETTTKKATKA
jgi:capsular exopolysaccharide synthesis family protein